MRFYAFLGETVAKGSPTIVPIDLACHALVVATGNFYARAVTTHRGQMLVPTAEGREYLQLPDAMPLSHDCASVSASPFISRRLQRAVVTALGQSDQISRYRNRDE